MNGIERENARNRRQRVRRTKALLKSKRLFDVILAHIRNGGTLITLCETWNVRYSDIIAWVREDKARKDAYETAGADRSEWSKEMILGEIRELSRPNMAALRYPKGHYREGEIKSLADMTAENLLLIKEIDKDGKIKFYDRLKALELGARSEKLLVDRTEHSGSLTLEDLLNEANKPPPAAAPAPGSPEKPA